MTSETQKAWTFTKGGLPRAALSLTTTHPIPTLPTQPSEEWILVRVSYAALNPGDVMYMNIIPQLARSKPAKTAAVPCYDFTGAVLDTTSAGTEGRFKKGDKVIGFLTIAHMMQTGTGALQETIAIPAKYAVHLPKGKEEKGAAGLLLAACTAAEQVQNARLKEGDRVLVVGGSGGVGSMAVQLTRLAVGGAGKVVGVCSGRNKDLVLGLGADEVIDYTEHEHIEDELAKRFGQQQPFDAVIDSYGNQTLFRHSSNYLKPDGVYSAAGVHATSYLHRHVIYSGVVILANNIWPVTPWLLGTGRVWKAASMMDPGLPLMERLVVAHFAKGELRVVVDSEWSFDRVLEAYDVLMSGHARGKILIKISS